jgi:hypothetical protein
MRTSLRPHDTPSENTISKSLNKKPESASTSAINGKSYRMLLHRKRDDPVTGMPMSGTMSGDAHRILGGPMMRTTTSHHDEDV